MKTVKRLFRAGMAAFGMPLVAAFGLVVLAAAVPAAAGQDPGVRVGYYGGADADEAVPVVGLYGRIDLPGPVNLEISADYRVEKLHGGDLESTVVPVRASAYVKFLPVISPYLLAGVGMDYNRITFRNAFAGTPASSRWLYEGHAGGGVEVSLGPFNIVGDVRYCLVGKVSDAGVTGVLGHDYDPSGWYASIAAGISF